jgi:predicted transposase YdaD
MAQEYDVTLKVLLRHFPNDFVRLVFGNVGAEINFLDRELEATKFYVDGLAQVTIGGETFIFHPEFFSSYDKNVPERMYNYAARITGKYPGLGVYGVALYINESDRDKPFPDAFGRRIFGELRTYHKCDVIKVWELDANDILRQQITGLLPVISLMKYRHEEIEKVIGDAIQQLQQKVEDAALRAEMFAGLYLFSGMKQLRILVTKLLREANMLELLEKSETYTRFGLIL